MKEETSLNLPSEKEHKKNIKTQQKQEERKPVEEKTRVSVLGGVCFRNLNISFYLPKDELKESV